MSDCGDRVTKRCGEVDARRVADLVSDRFAGQDSAGSSRDRRGLRGNPAVWQSDLMDTAESLYIRHSPNADLVTFAHGNSVYLFDLAGEPHVERTVLAVCHPAAPEQARDSTYQRGYPLPERHANRAVDRGHFIAYSSGGLYGPNLFVQDRALNRGWSEEGKRFRALERRAIAEAPDSLLFVLPHYIDETAVPAFLTLGVIGAAGMAIDTFRNRYDNPRALSLDVHLAGATASQLGDLGEETAGVLLEEDLGGTIVAMGDAGMPRNNGRQDLDLLVAIGGVLIAIEVKTRYLSRAAGQSALGTETSVAPVCAGRPPQVATDREARTT